MEIPMNMVMSINWKNGMDKIQKVIIEQLVYLYASDRIPK